MNDLKDKHYKAVLKLQDNLKAFKELDSRVESSWSKALTTVDFSKYSYRKLKKTYRSLIDELISSYRFSLISADVESVVKKTGAKEEQNTTVNDSEKKLAVEITSNFTNDVISGLNYDNEIIQNKLKFSLWLGVLSIAGLSALIFKGIGIVQSFFYLSSVVSILFFISIFITGLLYTKCNEHGALTKMQIVQFLRQKQNLLSFGYTEPLSKLISALRSLSLVDKVQTRAMERISNHMMEKLDNTSTKLIYFQQCLVFIGFLLLVIVSFFAVEK